MKNNTTVLVIAAILICLAAWGCIMGFGLLNNEQKVVDITPGATEFVEAIATPTPTQTPEVTPAPTPSSTPIPTLTPMPIVSHDPNKKVVALSFDDGPGGSSTAKILDLLEQYDAGATFFVVGTMLENHPENVQRAHALGCEIGNHTYDHELRFKGASSAAILAELEPVDNMLLELIGERASFIRPPWGAYDTNTCETVDRPIILWSVDTEDWKSRDCDSVVAEIKENVFDGAIILMHDLYTSTADACEIIIPWLIEQNYDIVSVGELLSIRGIVPQAGVMYRIARPVVTNNGHS